MNFEIKTVKDLIEELKKFPEDMPVGIPHYSSSGNYVTDFLIVYNIKVNEFLGFSSDIKPNQKSEQYTTDFLVIE